MAKQSATAKRMIAQLQRELTRLGNEGLRFEEYEPKADRIIKQIKMWRSDPPWPYNKANPRKVKGRSTTLKNMASVTIQKLPNGVVKITGRKMRGKR